MGNVKLRQMDIYNKTFRRGLRAKLAIDNFTITDISNEELEEILKPFMKKDIIVKSNDEIYLTTTRKDENETSI